MLQAPVWTSNCWTCHDEAPLLQNIKHTAQDYAEHSHCMRTHISAHIMAGSPNSTGIWSQTLCPELQWDNLTSYQIGTGGSHLHCAVNRSHLSYSKIQNIWTLSFTTPMPIQMEKAGFIFSILAILRCPGEYEFVYFQFCT